jgi:hypothetical protein
MVSQTPTQTHSNGQRQPESQELAIATESYAPSSGLASGSLLVRPIATAQDARGVIEDFQKLKISLLDPKTDIQVYKDRDGNITKRIKKSGCKKIAMAFGLDVKAVGREIIDLSTGNFAVEYTVRATAPNGRSCEGIGMCDSTESLYAGRKNKKLHDVYATAFTRAANRAVLDLVGGGEVSAEEVTGEETISAGRQPIPQAWLDKLDNLVKDLPDGKTYLAKFVFEEIGARYLSKEEIVRVAEKLQKEIAKTAKPVNLPVPTHSSTTTPEPGPAAQAATSTASLDKEIMDPAIRERLHRAAWIEQATQIQTVTPAGKWMSVSGDQFDRASRLITGGREIVEIAEMMGIDKFSTEAKRRYNGQLKTYDQQLSAGLHVLAEWCESHPSETVFPDEEGDAASEDFFSDDGEFDDDQEYIK